MCGGCPNCAMDKQKVVYQIHVTVDSDGRILLFKNSCHHIGVQAVSVSNISLENEKWESDYFTSSVVHEGIYEAMSEGIRIMTKLTEFGHNVARFKVETVPWNPLIPSFKKMHRGYYESHISIPSQEFIFRPELKDILNKHDAKVSINVSAPLIQQKAYLTLRDYDTDWPTFQKKVVALHQNLLDSDFEVLKVISEYAVFDTNPAHDKAWFG